MSLQHSHPDNSFPAQAPRLQTQTIVFAMFTLAYLAPLWVFPYLPTQDGPLHLANALIIKDFRAPGTRYAEFFELRWEPLPNWTTHLLLSGLMHVTTPLIAEKIVASLYVIGFAWSFRFFLGAFGDSTLRLAPVVFLFLFNRCFLMGFYNYCLSLIFLWLMLGYCIRRQKRLDAVDGIVLLAVWPLAYFTHLLGYALAAAGAIWSVATASCLRGRNLLWVGGSLLPTACLACTSLIQPRFLGLSETASRTKGLAFWNPQGLSGFWSDFGRLNQELFEPYEDGFPLQFFVLFFYAAVILATLFASRQSWESTANRPNRLSIIVFGAILGALYFVVPNHPSLAVGFLKARLALLPPLLWLACLRLPPAGLLRHSLGVGLYLLLGVNLILVARHFHTANQELQEFTAGINCIGYNRTLFVAHSFPEKRLVNPLGHAANYYCLTTGNVNLDNFQAGLRHFPVFYRRGVNRGHGSWAAYANKGAVDVILVWNTKLDLAPTDSYLLVYQGGLLQIYMRTRLVDERLSMARPGVPIPLRSE